MYSDLTEWESDEELMVLCSSLLLFSLWDHLPGRAKEGSGRGCEGDTRIPLHAVPVLSPV